MVPYEEGLLEKVRKNGLPQRIGISLVPKGGDFIEKNPNWKIVIFSETGEASKGLRIIQGEGAKAGAMSARIENHSKDKTKENFFLWIAIVQIYLRLQKIIETW